MAQEHEVIVSSETGVTSTCFFSVEVNGHHIYRFDNEATALLVRDNLRQALFGEVEVIRSSLPTDRHSGWTERRDG